MAMTFSHISHGNMPQIFHDIPRFPSFEELDRTVGQLESVESHRPCLEAICVENSLLFYVQIRIEPRNIWDILSGKLTVGHWKSPISSGNSSSNPDDCQGRTVDLLEGNWYIFIHIEKLLIVFDNYWFPIDNIWNILITDGWLMIACAHWLAIHQRWS